MGLMMKGSCVGNNMAAFHFLPLPSKQQKFQTFVFKLNLCAIAPGFAHILNKISVKNQYNITWDQNKNGGKIAAKKKTPHGYCSGTAFQSRVRV